MGDKVRFLVADVFLPSQETASKSFFAEIELQGTIVDFSDSGKQTRQFAVVDVVKHMPVVVPVEKLEMVMPTDSDDESKPHSAG